MQLDVSLLVTNETSGGLIGSTHGAAATTPFVAKVSDLTRLAPCAFVTAVPQPAGSADKVTFQVQNFSSVAATVATGSLADYVRRSWDRHHLMPQQLGAFTLPRDGHLLIVPYAPPPLGFVAKKHFFKSGTWGADGVHLKWSKTDGIDRYRIHKLIVLQKGSQPWYVHQKWHSDTGANEFLDTDYKREAFEGFNADTIYCVSALPFPDFPGAPTPGVTFGALDQGGKDWIQPTVALPPDWI